MCWFSTHVHCICMYVGHVHCVLVSPCSYCKECAIVVVASIQYMKQITMQQTSNTVIRLLCNGPYVRFIEVKELSTLTRL